MRKRIGPIVRINPDEIHVKDPDWYEVLYAGGRAKRDKYPPAASMSGVSSGSMFLLLRLVSTLFFQCISYAVVLPSIIFQAHFTGWRSGALTHQLAVFGTTDHDLHRRRRAALSSYFSKGSIRSIETQLTGQVDLLCDQLRQSLALEEVVDLRLSFLALATDIICDHGIVHPFPLSFASVLSTSGMVYFLTCTVSGEGTKSSIRASTRSNSHLCSLLIAFRPTQGSAESQ